MADTFMSTRRSRVHARLRAQPWMPRCHLGDELVSEQVQRAAQEGHHPSGTCEKVVQNGDAGRLRHQY